MRGEVKWEELVVNPQIAQIRKITQMTLGNQDRCDL